MFQHKGERSPETDKIAEELARHKLIEKYPTVQMIGFTWTQHHQPDMWLLFVSGIVSDSEKGTT